MTTFNVDAFKSALTNGGVRPNQFAVQLSYPTYVGNAAGAVAKSPFLVTVAELPGQTMGQASVLYRGREVVLAGDRVFAPWTITVLNDAEMSIRTALEQWLNGIEDLANKTGRQNPVEYQRDIDIFQLNRNGNVLKTYKLVNAFPVDISPVALDFNANDQISSFQVTWRYQHFESSNNPLAAAFNVSQLFR